MAEYTSVEAEDALDLTPQQCCEFMLRELTCEACVESVMKWHKARFVPHTGVMDSLQKSISFSAQLKSKKRMTVEIEHMTDVRTRPFSDEGEVVLKENERERFFCIAFWDKGCYHDFVNVVLLNVLAPDRRSALVWRKGLRWLISQNAWTSPRYVSPVERAVSAFSAFRQKQLDPTKAHRKALARALNRDAVDEIDVVLSQNGVDPLFDASVYTQEDVELLFARMSIRPEMKTLFTEVASHHKEGEGYMTDGELEQFLRTTQRDKRANEVLEPFHTITDCRALITRYEPNRNLRHKNRLSLIGFARLMMSDRWDPMHPGHRSVYQDMSQPMAHYYIASSHNTYLTGSQINSKSTVEIYRQVLLSGCRCIELDTWDGSKEPEITHGRTRCTRIEFRKVVQAIRDFAFVTTPYPLILSIENHCSVPQMKIMASVFKAELGDYLLTDFLPGDGFDSLPSELPPPERLKYKILIKNKKIQHSFAPNAMTRSEAPANGFDALPQELAPLEIVVDGEVVREDEEEARQRRERSGEIAEELSDLVNYVTPFRFAGFDIAFELNNCYLMSSFNENKAMRFVAGSPKDFVKFGRTNLSRIYPAGTRYSSTNFNPQLFWNVGSQMVSLNYQTPGAHMQLNLGKFMQNGRCGYVLKPLPLCEEAEFDPFEKKISLKSISPLDIRVEILHAQNLGKKDIAPYVHVQLIGLPADTNKKWKTRPSRGKGLYPCWDTDNVAEFKHVLLPDIAQLMFTVVDQKDQKTLGHYCVPVNSMTTGYRVLPLAEARSPLALLFVNIVVNIFVPNEHRDFADKLTNPTAYSSVTAKHMAAMEQLVDQIQDSKEEAEKDQELEQDPENMYEEISEEEVPPMPSGGSNTSLGSAGAAAPASSSSSTSTPERLTLAAISAGSSASLVSGEFNFAKEPRESLFPRQETVPAGGEGFGENFTQALRQLLIKQHVFEQVPSSEHCKHCNELLPKKAGRCRCCGMFLHETCTKKSKSAQLAQSCVFQGATETKRSWHARAKFQKTCNEMVQQFNKDRKQLAVLLQKDLRTLQKIGAVELKSAKRRVARNIGVGDEASEVASKISEVFVRLVDRFLDYHEEVFQKFLDMMTQKNTMALELQDSLNRISEAELWADHDTHMTQVEEVLAKQQKKVMMSLRKSAKHRKSNWDDERGNAELKLVSLVDKTRKQIKDQNTGEEVVLRQQLDAEKRQLESKISSEITAAKDKHHRQKMAMRRLKSEDPFPWHEQSVQALADHFDAVVNRVE